MHDQLGVLLLLLLFLWSTSRIIKNFPTKSLMYKYIFSLSSVLVSSHNPLWKKEEKDREGRRVVRIIFNCFGNVAYTVGYIEKRKKKKKSPDLAFLLP